ncbi:MAG: helix-turn-helix domain-containing protein [Deltaproteobacteria bacterium]|nr:helix-turn-helix domain-containing protein [Deltaproteobacteria bacterium]
MKRVTILALDHTVTSSVMGTMDILCQVGVTYNLMTGIAPKPRFDVEIVSLDGQPVVGFNQTRIDPHRSAAEVEATDLIIIGSFMDFETLSTCRAGIPWLRHHFERGATLASICSGAFFLAETGLLDGKRAATHWGLADEFRRRYPRVRLDPDLVVADEGRLLSSGACSSYIDLAVYLIERYCGSTVALQASKAMLHDFSRASQTPYCVYLPKRDHGDDQILSIQALMEQDFARDLDMVLIAQNNGMSRRTFERRFKSATGDTPLVYVQRIRVEAAKQLLESGRRTCDEVAYRVGYEDSGFFRRLFVKYTGLRPSDYQTKFRRTVSEGP